MEAEDVEALVLKDRRECKECREHRECKDFKEHRESKVPSAQVFKVLKDHKVLQGVPRACKARRARQDLKAT